MKGSKGIVLIAVCGLAGVTLGGTTADLVRKVAEDVVRPVRPGGVDGRPFWNVKALWFMYPPAFDFKDVAGAKGYRFVACDRSGKERTMTASSPRETISALWPELATGLVDLRCEGVDTDGKAVGVAGTRRFWKQAPFRPGAYPKAKRSYREAADRLMDFLVDGWKPAQVLAKTGRPDPVYQYNGYPAKIGSSLINIMVTTAKERPAKAAKALDIAKKEADYLISITPTNGPLAYFAPTYLYLPESEGPHRLAPATCKKHLGECMIRYSAEVGIAMLRLAEATGEEKYADFAVRCGETFIRLQRPDGTWPCVMRYSDGAAMRRDNIILIERVDFFTRLAKRTGDRRYAKLEDDVLATVEREQFATWDWQGQFEDTTIEPEPYKDLTSTDALPFACYLLKRFPGDARRLAEATELVRFAEDQFVCWEKPYLPDGTSPSSGLLVEGKWYDGTFKTWYCPGVSEQYACMVPIDASLDRMVWGCLALYHATKDELWLQKAWTLGDSLVNKQQENGGIETYWYETGMRLTESCDEIDWLDCMMDDLEALLDLAREASRGN